MRIVGVGMMSSSLLFVMMFASCDPGPSAATQDSGLPVVTIFGHEHAGHNYRKCNDVFPQCSESCLTLVLPTWGFCPENELIDPHDGACRIEPYPDYVHCEEDGSFVQGDEPPWQHGWVGIVKTLDGRRILGFEKVNVERFCGERTPSKIHGGAR